ncbi:hypothetical protein T11_18544 [Trichinella zimbabwensis]|uniref:Uncharacterized protein n=1 Tax=Trichinella zimbabwensis TaxID=268475 RepID=A0A0V1HHT4_9BILA|nr:hypothetical protein T11_18544 [Trichinella zimbabwensis]
MLNDLTDRTDNFEHFKLFNNDCTVFFKSSIVNYWKLLVMEIDEMKHLWNNSLRQITKMYS